MRSRLMSRRVPVFRKVLRDLRWQLIGYGVGMALYAALIALLYPSFRETLGDFELPEFYAMFLGGEGEIDFAAPENFFALEFFSIAPVIIAIYAIVTSTGLLAGDEGRGSLELVLAQPISRTRVFVEGVAALLVGAVLICAATAAGWLLTIPLIDVGGEEVLSKLVVGSFNLFPITVAFVAAGLLLGAVAPTRGLAAGVLAMVTVAMYLANSVATLVDAISWLRYLSPFWYADSAQAVAGGATWWHPLVLLASAAVLTLLALIAFRRREIGTGHWQLAVVLGRAA